MTLEHGKAVTLIDQFSPQMQGSPRYLNMAANLLTRIGLHDRAYPLHLRATELQPDADQLAANLAACAVLNGKLDQARAIYEGLLAKNPDHQRNHYELSRLGRATDSTHIDAMKSVLERTNLPAPQNIFIYYAIAKELEDLEQYDEAFEYYSRAGNAARSVADYDVATDIEIIDTTIETCSSDWIKGSVSRSSTKRPIFVVGLPRSGTTLTERIISSHSQVQSVDETFFMQLAVKAASGIRTAAPMSPEIIRKAASYDPSRITNSYLASIAYKLDAAPRFVEKLPENFLYLGFIARAFPDAHLVMLERHPMDVCFAMYKQSFFRYAYTLADLSQYFIAFDRLRAHWREVLSDRLIELRYEDLVSDQESATRQLLKSLDLPFEAETLHFDRNATPTATASSVQVREKIHTRSVGHWKHFEDHLEPLSAALIAAGIVL